MKSDHKLIADLTAQALAHVSGPTLEDVRRIVATAADLAPNQRRDLVSALSFMARAFRLPLTSLPAEKRRLAEYVKKLNHAQLGVGKKRLSNAKSNLWAALDYAAAGKALPKRSPLSEEWAARREQLPTRRFRIGLSRLMRYHSAIGVSAESVSDATLADFRAYLETSTYRDSRDLHRDACRIWNEAVSQIDGWPQIRLTQPCYKTTPDSIAWECFPGSFTEEVERFLLWVSGRDLLTRDPPAKVCEPSTLTLKRKQLQLIASAAVHGGFDISELTSLEVLAGEPCLRACVHHYTTKPARPSDRYLFDLLCTMKAMARGWLKADEARLKPITRLMKYFHLPAPGLTAKNRACLRQFDTDENKALLLNLPARLLDPKRLARLSPKRRAIEVATALAIEFLIVAPMRIDNLVQLRTDRHVHRPSARRKQAFLILNESEVKNTVPLEFPLPDSAMRLLEDYLAKHHPVLAPSGSPYLFAAPGGRARNTDSFAKRIQETIKRETGLTMTCHQFRHVAAKFYLDAHPGGYEVVRRLLGHKNIRTTINFYAGMDTRAAVKHYDDSILELRKALPSSPKPNRRGPRSSSK